jgi:hypothetical protein
LDFSALDLRGRSPSIRAWSAPEFTKSVCALLIDALEQKVGRCKGVLETVH